MITINTVPTEVLDAILDFIPMIGNASSIMRVCTKWNAIYKALIYRKRENIIDKMIYSEYEDWSIPKIFRRFIDFDRFIADKLIKFHKFSPNINPDWDEAYDARDSLSKRLAKLERERDKIKLECNVILKLEQQFYSERPDWLIKRGHNNANALVKCCHWLIRLYNIDEQITTYF